LLNFSIFVNQQIASMDISLSAKIRMARRLNRLSMDELVLRMGENAVSKMAISKMERGLLNPSSNTLEAIAHACNLPIRFFLAPDLNIVRMDFRHKANATKRQRQEIEATVQNLLIQYWNLQSINTSVLAFEHPLKGVTLRNYNDVEVAATKLRKKWEIGCQPIHSVYELLAEHGIHVLELNFGCDAVEGVSTLLNNQIPTMVINTLTNTTTERKRFTAMHELAHLIFRLCPDDSVRHQQYIDSLPKIPYEVLLKQPDIERLCHRFAGAMLLPESSTYRRFGHMRTEITIQEFIHTRNLYGISVAAQAHRLHDLRIIDDKYYNHIFEDIIKPNPMEDGWGLYPIMEIADQKLILEERVKVEMAKKS